MDERAGFTTPNLLEAETNRALVAAVRRLADHTKWATVDISTIARLDEANALVTGEGLSRADRATLGEMVG
jgi:DeoR/GlpR family transcriptional regulator of sugar metabolism